MFGPVAGEQRTGPDARFASSASLVSGAISPSEIFLEKMAALSSSEKTSVVYSINP